MVEIEPSTEHQVPYDLRDETTGSFMEEMAVAANTAEAQQALGREHPPTLYSQTMEEFEADMERMLSARSPAMLRQPAVALATAEFLRTYGSQLAIDVTAMRVALTNKLVELANCGQPQYELKAIEMLGKHSDVGLFTERSEVTINYKDPESLEAAIKERVKRLLNADIIDVTPATAQEIDAELGEFDLDAAKAARVWGVTVEESIKQQEELEAGRKTALATKLEAMPPLQPRTQMRKKKLSDPGQPLGHIRPPTLPKNLG